MLVVDAGCPNAIWRDCVLGGAVCGRLGYERGLRVLGGVLVDAVVRICGNRVDCACVISGA